MKNRLSTTLHLKEGENINPSSSQRSRFAFVEFNLSELKRFIPDAYLFAWVDKKARQANSSEGLLALCDYDDFVRIIKPELERSNIHVDDPLDTIKRYQYINAIFNRPGVSEVTDAKTKVDNLLFSTPNHKLHVTSFHRTGRADDLANKIYSIKADKQYRILRFIPETAYVHHSAQGELIINVRASDFKEILPKIIEQSWEIELLEKKFFGDPDRIFFGADKMPLTELVTPSDIDHVKVITHRLSQTPTLMKSILAAGSDNERGETRVKKAVCLLKNGRERVMDFSSLNVSYRASTESEKRTYKLTKDYLNHPFYNQSSNVRPVSQIKNERTQIPVEQMEANIVKNEITPN